MKFVVIMSLIAFSAALLLLIIVIARHEQKTMKVMLDYGAYRPLRAHSTDAGLDIRSPRMAVVRAHGSSVIKTGVHIELPKGTAGVLISKSGLNINHDITSTGLIDEGYTGEICVKLYNHGTEPYYVQAGDKISQLVVIPVLYVRGELVHNIEEFNDSERGSSGFGSSGR